MLLMGMISTRYSSVLVVAGLTEKITHITVGVESVPDDSLPHFQRAVKGDRGLSH